MASTRDEKMAELHAALLAIERGKRVEAIDDVLIRQMQLPLAVSRHPQRQRGQQESKSEHVSKAEVMVPDVLRPNDAYRALVALKRQRKMVKQTAIEEDSLRRKREEELAKENARGEDRQPTQQVLASPCSPGKTARRSKSISPTRKGISDATTTAMGGDRMNGEVRTAAEAKRVMSESLARTEKQLERSQQEVTKAADEMQQLLKQSQAVLSSQFLFERNLTEFCQSRSLEVIQSAMARFQHRFFKQYLHRWVAATAALREAERRRAAATIRRVYMGHQGRRWCRTLRVEQDKMEAQRQQVIALRVSYRLHQARRIQLVWKRFLWRRLEARRMLRKRAAVYLQRAWKLRRLQRNRLVNLIIHARQSLAAIRIQKIVRGCATRVRINRDRVQARRAALAMERMRRNTSRDALLHWQMECKGAIFVITRAFYPALIRRRFRRLLRLHKEAQAGETISRCVCFWYGLQERRDRKKAEWVNVIRRQYVRVEHAAVCIQKNIKRWNQQRDYEMQRRRAKKLAQRERIRVKQLVGKGKEDKIPIGSNVDAKQPRRSSKNVSSISLAVMTRYITTVGAPVISAANPASRQGLDLTASAANKIRQCFLQHQYYKHNLRSKWRKQAVNVECELRRRQTSAVAIQKRFRGNQGRAIARMRRAEQLLRRYIRQWRWKRASIRSRAAGKIARWLKVKRTQHNIKRWKQEKENQHVMASRLQQWLHLNFFFHRRLGELITKNRLEEETKRFCEQSLVVCTQHIVDDMILASFRSPFENPIRRFLRGNLVSPQTSLQPEKAYPILQVMFLVISGLKDVTKWGEFDVNELLATKMERSKVVALFKAVGRHSSPSKTKQVSPSKSGKTRATDVFTSSDVDIAMSKVSGSTKRAISFDEFKQVLQILGDLKLTTISVWWSRYDGPEARLLALLWRYLFVLVDIKPLVIKLMDCTTTMIHSRCLVVQRLFIRRRNKVLGQRILIDKHKERDMEAKSLVVVKIQTRVRICLAKLVLKIKIQEQYDKYIDSEWGLPYWMNPRTGYSTWQKPRELGNEDVFGETVPFPPADLTLTAQCQGNSDCAMSSDWFCFECEELFCDNCMKKFHKEDKNGISNSHEMDRLQKCGLCRFQIASRRCADCFKHGAPGNSRLIKQAEPRESASESMAPNGLPVDDEANRERESLFCDVCFEFIHKKGAMQTHKSTALVEMCDDCASDDGGELNPTTIPPHKPSPRAVQWECQTCDPWRRVCARCAIDRHPVEACGNLSRVLLSTLNMRRRANRIIREREARERADTEKMKAKELRAKQERFAKKIQIFWRNQAPLLRARRVVRSLRAEKDTKWSQIQEDAKTQRKLKYALKNVLGIAPALPSDSPIQQKLRDMNAFQRRQLIIRAKMFGLLLHEYMQLGVPLPGVAIISPGNDNFACSSDLRGWILNRQTIRLKKLSMEQPILDRVWQHDLKRWVRSPEDTILVDVSAKDHISQHTVPLACAFNPNDQGRSSESTTAIGNGDQSCSYAMFLVEFSMDPTRVVWVNHSFAERFAVWRRQKLRAFRAFQAERKADRAKKLRLAKESVGTDPVSTSAVSGDSSKIPPSIGNASGEIYANANDIEERMTQDIYEATEYMLNNGAVALEMGGMPVADANVDSCQYRAFGDVSASTWGSPYGGDYYSTSQAYTDDSGVRTETMERVTSASYPLVNSDNYFYSSDGNAEAWNAYYASQGWSSEYNADGGAAEYPSGYDSSSWPGYTDQNAQYEPDTNYQYDANAAAMTEQYYDPNDQSNSTWGVGTPSVATDEALWWGTPEAAEGNDAYSSEYQGGDYASYNAAAAEGGSYEWTSTEYLPQPIPPEPATSPVSPWEEVFDPSSNQVYYFNHITQETSWQLPEGL